MTDPAQHLAALVGARLCHDLISPIGAIGNGVELMALDPRPKPAEIALLADSVASANARLRFFRIAFGVATQGQSTSRIEIVPLLGDLYRTGRIAVDWTSPVDLPRAEVKLAFLMILCAEHAIPTGGNIKVVHDDNGWRITAASPRLRHDGALWSLLDTPFGGPEIEPSQVQFPLAGLTLDHLARRATVDVALANLTISF